MSDHFGTLCIQGLSTVPRLSWNTTTASISWFFTAFHIFTIFLLYRLFSVCLLIRLVFKSCEESRKNNLRLNYIVLLRIIRLESFKLQPHKIEKHIQTIGRLLRTNCLSVFDHFVELVLNPIQDGLFRGYSRMGGKKVPHPKICHTSCNNETWHNYTLPKEDPKNIWITGHIPWVLLISAFFYWKSANFGISRNTDVDCILIHNFKFF